MPHYLYVTPRYMTEIFLLKIHESEAYIFKNLKFSKAFFFPSPEHKINVITILPISWGMKYSTIKKQQ